MNPVVIPWLVEIGIISWRSLSGTHFSTQKAATAQTPFAQKSVVATGGVKRPPLPSELLATFVIFGTYAVIAEKNAQIGQLLAWGTVLATGLIFLSGGTPAAGTSGTFPPTQYPQGGLTRQLPGGANYPPQGGR